jgi:hypothetical protein
MLLRESLEHDPNYSLSLHRLGKILINKKSPEGKALLKKLIEVMQYKINQNNLSSRELYILINAAEILYNKELLQRLQTPDLITTHQNGDAQQGGLLIDKNKIDNVPQNR